MKTGLDVVLVDPSQGDSWGRVGLLMNQASVDGALRPAWRGFHEILGKRLTTLFGPQHGIGGTEQYNMIETSHGTHAPTGLPVYSLYSETRVPTPDMFRDLDTVVVDLQISGCRIYTWKATIAAVLEAARRDGKRVVVLDRPNPLGGQIMEGRTLDDDVRSFVGVWQAPLRHPLTTGEAALFMNTGIGAELEVVKLAGWDPLAQWPATGRPWVLTSPMLPHFDAVAVYPGLVLVEGTGMSEGRGTTLPFQLIGAPYINDAPALVRRVQELLPEPTGVLLRDAVFTPTWNKWQGRPVAGVQLHVTDPAAVRSFPLALAIIRAFFDCGGDAFAWEKPGYEYDYENLPFNLLAGSKRAADKLTATDFSLDDPFWQEGIAAFKDAAEALLLYDRPLVAG